MDEILTLLILLTEVLMIFQCLKIAFKQKLQFDRYMVGIVVIDCIIFVLINYGILPQVCSIAIYILIFVFCYYRFKQRLIKTTVGMIIGLSIAGLSQVIVGCVASFFAGLDNSLFALFILSCFSLILTNIISKGMEFVHFKRTIRDDKTKLLLVSLYGFALVILLVDYYLSKSAINIYAAFILVFLIFIYFYIFRLERAQNEIEKKKYELELQRIYGGTYEELLKEVRRRQHDFKNQIGAIYSMHLVARSLDELIDMQRKYGDALLTECKFDSILMCCNNSILAGYIYYRCISCEKEGIDINYNIHIEQATCSLAIHEIIEVLGILIDNACENFAIDPVVNKCLKFNFQEDDSKILFSVSNPAKYANSSEIEKMFLPGYSKKGENRGIGLARVRELLKKHDAEIIVSNYTCEEKNWIDFTVNITK